MLTYSRKLAILLAFHTVWGLALGWSISKYGLGVSTDSTSYMFAGVNWITGRGLVDFQGEPYTFWPPLYPMLIGLMHLGGASMFGGTHIIQFAAFALLSWFSSIFFLKLFPEDFKFALFGAFLLNISVVVVSNFHMVGTDYLFILFPVICALLLNEYAETQRWSTLTLIGLTVSLAMLTRYLGYALVLTALIAVLVYTKGSALKRFLSAAYTGIFTLSPFLWMLVTWKTTDGIRREPLPFGEYAAQFTYGIMSWFIVEPPHFKELTAWHYAIVWVPVLLAGVLVFTPPIRRHASSPLVWSMLGFGAIYTIALFTTALIAYFNRLWGRFHLPIYLPLIVLFLIVIHHGLRYLKENAPRNYPPAFALAFAFLAVTGIMQLDITIDLLRYARDAGMYENSINTRQTNENTIIQYWNEHPPQGEFRLFSNYAALAAFFTRHEAHASPRKSPLYSDTIIPLNAYMTVLFGNEKDVYLLWIEPNPRELAYKPNELSEVAEVIVIIENEDGGIYLLHRINSRLFPALVQ